MSLTRAQKKLLDEAEEIAFLTKLDIWSIEDMDAEFRLHALRAAIDSMVRAELIKRYALIDEILSELIARYFFKQQKKNIHFGKLWRTKKFRIFNHRILDEIFLLKKMEIVHAIRPLPGDVIKIIQKLNGLRNAFAHSFFPENRKESYKSRKVLYNGKDIRTAEGLTLFLDDWDKAWLPVVRRAYPKWK